MKQILIIGGGITGLTIGYELVKRGQPVTIIEKENEIGGLSGSFRYDDFIYDIGPHRFFTNSKQALNFIEEILKDDAISITRDSKVYFKGKYYQWPLHLNILFNLPLSIQIKTILDLFFRKRKKEKEKHTFQEYILNNYGPTLYNCFFRDYTQKFLNIPPDLLDADWAKIGMAMAIIDERLSSTNLWEIFKLAIKPAQACTTFLYSKGGICLFCNKLERFIIQHGGRILKGRSVLNIGQSSKRIDSIVTDKEVLKCDSLIWTAPINEICRLLYLPGGNLEYLSLVLYNVSLRRKSKKSFQWCYFGDEDIIFNRVSNPSMFDPNSAPRDKTGLCVEVTCRENDELWNNPEKLIFRIKKDLVKVNLIDDPTSISSICIERIPNAYPIYDLNYKERLKVTKENLGKFKNLILAGRTGLFWYNNMDDCITNGLISAERLLKE